MANFLAFLKNSGSFDDVQLEQFYQDDQHDRLAYKFTLSCLFKSATAGIPPRRVAHPRARRPGGPAGGPPVHPAGWSGATRAGSAAPKARIVGEGKEDGQDLQ